MINAVNHDKLLILSWPDKKSKACHDNGISHVKYSVRSQMANYYEPV